MAKLYDICAATREYTDQNGQTKRKYENIGAVMQGNEGGQYILLARWFNPAGIVEADRAPGESIMLSCFAPNDSGQRPQAPQQQAPQQQAPQYQAQPMPGGAPAGNWGQPR